MLGQFSVNKYFKRQGKNLISYTQSAGNLCQVPQRLHVRHLSNFVVKVKDEDIVQYSL